MSKQKMVMVVDDEELVRDVLCSSLKYKGYKTVPIDNGRSAISFAEKNKPDIILMDIRMPGLNGIETCSRLKKMLKSAPTTGIIMITGYDAIENLENAYRSGAIDLIRKPFDMEDINRRINIWFNVRDIKDDLSRLLTYSEKVMKPEKDT